MRTTLKSIFNSKYLIFVGFLALIITSCNVDEPFRAPAGQQNIENYAHRYVLRTSINSTWGVQIAQRSVDSGTSASQSYSITLDNSLVES